jgi:hypothetical protein
MLPLAAALVFAFSASSGCEDECHGNVVYFAPACLFAPLAAIGVLLLRPGLLKVAAGVGVGLFAAAALAGGVYITLEIIGS